MTRAQILTLILEDAYPSPPKVREGSVPLNEGRPRRPVIEDEPRLEIIGESAAECDDRRLRELQKAGAILGW